MRKLIHRSSLLSYICIRYLPKLPLISRISIVGCHGRTADKRANSRTRVALRHVRHLHDGPGLGAYIRPDDQHLPVTERRGDQQATGSATGPRIAPRAHARFHRISLGLFHGPRALSLPRRGGDFVLGQVLGLLVHGGDR